MHELFPMIEGGVSEWPAWVGWFLDRVGKPKDWPEVDSEEGSNRYEPWRKEVNKAAAASGLDDGTLMGKLESAVDALVTDPGRTRTGVEEGFGAGFTTTLWQDLLREFRRITAPQIAYQPERQPPSPAEMHRDEERARAAWKPLDDSVKAYFIAEAQRRFPFTRGREGLYLPMAMALNAWPEDFGPEPLIKPRAIEDLTFHDPESLKEAKKRAMKWRDSLPDVLKRLFNAVPTERQKYFAQLAARDQPKATSELFSEPRPPSIDPEPRYYSDLRTCRDRWVNGLGWPDQEALDDAFGTFQNGSPDHGPPQAAG